MQKTACIFKALIPLLPPWDPDSIYTGVGGSEECIIYSAEALKNWGFKVSVLNNMINKEKYSNPSINPCYAGYLRKDDFFDVSILHDDPQFSAILRERTRKLFFIPNNHCQNPLTEKEITAFDDILWLSSWQRNQWCSVSPGLAKFTKIFGNALQASQFKPLQERKNPYSCIYASDYGRGLYKLLDIWPNIKEKFPLATLDVYYGLRNWKRLSPEEEECIRERLQAFKTLGVTDHGRVGHFELATAFSKASMWTYPCNYPETFCITGIKAQFAGAVPVIVERDALAETVKFGFKCLDENDYEDLLINAMSQIETISLEERKKMGRFIRDNFTWEKMTSKWMELF
jgi:glycosyltransferase involved in cell wall biosynthesis